MKPQSQPILMENWYWFHGICANNVLCHLLWSRTVRIGTTHVGDGSRKKMLNYEFMDRDKDMVAASMAKAAAANVTDIASLEMSRF